MREPCLSSPSKMSEIGRLLWLQIELSRMDAVLGEQQSLEGCGFRPADGFR